jgi:hypothetical protein
MFALTGSSILPVHWFEGCIGCRSGQQDRQRPHWRMAAFERPSPYGDRTLKPITRMAISRSIVLLQLAVQRSPPNESERQTNDT